MQATKGKRPIVNPIKRLSGFNRLIDIAMARKGIKRDGELALEFEPLEVAEAMGVAA